MKRRLKHFLTSSLKYQLIFYIIVGILLPLIGVMAFLFARTRTEMKNQAVENIQQQLEIAASKIEQMIYNIHAVSDNNAYNETFEEYTMKYYGNSLMEKRRDIHLLLTMFVNGDLLNTHIQMSAVLTKHKELLNFVDPLVDSQEVIDKLYEMGIDNKENLSKIIWHPVQKNFLIEGFSGELRTDQVVIGTRRIINFYSGLTNAIHIFAIPEERIWEAYKDIVSNLTTIQKDKNSKELEGAIYIIDPSGGIISTSDEKALEEGRIDDDILNEIQMHKDKEFPIQYHDKKFLISIENIQNADWTIVAMVQSKTVTQTVDDLFVQIIIVAAVGVIICLLLILYISDRFVAPIDTLKRSMQEVHAGNLDAYVNMPGEGEIQTMGKYYNAMLRQINQFIVNKVETEKKKKQLELEVIMGQVNPHFLYNTLENIVWKSSEAGYPEIGRIAASLGRLYRLSINDGKIIVRIQQEIEHLMAYINIQKVRYKERVEFDLLVDYEQIKDYQTIKLILQPVVENCFMYALENIDHILKIWVKIKVFEDSIRIEVIDNGSGMDEKHLYEIRYQIRHGSVKVPEELKTIRKKGTGIGLYSINERIKLYFGKNNAVTIRSKRGVGTIVSIVIPKMQKQDKNRL